MTNSDTPSSIHRGVVPSEVGWQFVPQYYTFVNKQPNRLHCFYTKASTFIHGTEGEDGKPCYGQQEIHNKITSIGFQDCKVFIHSVDAQSSANGGIIIQVIGEMSNHGDPWRKFVQTFFLAEQTNGYFVLNDIFRFLKEETVESDDTGEFMGEFADVPPTPSAPEVAPAAPAPAPVQEPEPAFEQPREPSPAPPAVVPATPASPAPVDEAPMTDIPELAATATPTLAPDPQPQTTTTQPNGIHAHTPDPEPTPAPPPAPPSVEKSPTPAPAQPVPIPPTASPAPVPAASTPPPVAAVAPALSSAAPPAPKTWANLAAANSKKWGSNVAQESRGTTEVPACPAPGSGTQTPSPGPGTSGRGPPHHGGPHPGRGEHPAFVAAQSVTTAHCFVKGVIEPVSQTTLTTALTQRFGPIKELEIVRSKACAFLEFSNLESARRAIVASLPQGQGGEGGIRIEVGGEVGQVRILVETKKERGERPVSRPRGGAPVNGEARGGAGGSGFRGRGPSGSGGGGSGRGRGTGGK